MTSTRRIVLALGLYAALLFVLRVSGPPNLVDNDQERPASYVVDAVLNGHWIVQYDWTGDITSKPPAYTWLAALVSLAFARPNLLSLYLPCGLAMFGTAVLVAHETARHASARIAGLAGLFVLANPLAWKLVALARTDPLFTFAVTLTAVLTFRAWESGRGWTAAWAAAAFATLTKGPFGLVLGFSGLLAWPWERRTARIPWGRQHLAGFALWLILVAGWFLLAWAQAGDALVRKMLGAELVQHAVGTGGSVRGAGLALAPLYFVTRFVPWSLPALFGVWRTFRHPRPACSRSLARFERFATAWLLAGLLLLGLASHQRGDLVAPLLPAGAILAALSVDRWARGWSSRRLAVTSVTVALLIALGSQVQYVQKNRGIAYETRALADLARRLSRPDLSGFRILHVDSPYALQFFLGTMDRAVTVEDASRHLRASPRNSVAVSDRAALAMALGADASRLVLLARCPETGPPRVEVVSLRPSTLSP